VIPISSLSVLAAFSLASLMILSASSPRLFLDVNDQLGLSEFFLQSFILTLQASDLVGWSEFAFIA
jgi:hypothetical protein